MPAAPRSYANLLAATVKRLRLDQAMRDREAKRRLADAALSGIAGMSNG